MTTWFLLNGAIHAVNEHGVPDGATVVPRPPESCEEWIDGAWVRNGRMWADQCAGAQHIAEARALKYLEAVTIRAGTDLPDGMLAAEAAQKGITVAELAEEVLARRAEFIAAELVRQARQDGADLT